MVIRIARDQLKNFEESGSPRNPGGTQNIRNRETEAWTALPVGFMKINWDASIDKSKNKMGIGVMVRDFTRKVLATFCETKPYVQDPSSAEACAARQAVELSLTLGWRKVILEGDKLSRRYNEKKVGGAGMGRWHDAKKQMAGEVYGNGKWLMFDVKATMWHTALQSMRYPYKMNNFAW